MLEEPRFVGIDICDVSHEIFSTYSSNTEILVELQTLGGNKVPSMTMPPLQKSKQ
eukprot:COSAG05_NODE_517_length_9060_cov_7.019306_8_plen_55_part_00